MIRYCTKRYEIKKKQKQTIFAVPQYTDTGNEI